MDFASLGENRDVNILGVDFPPSSEPALHVTPPEFWLKRKIGSNEIWKL